MNNAPKYKFITYLFLLLSVFVVLLFSKEYYWNILENSNQIVVLEKKYDDKNKELNDLSNIQKEVDGAKIDELNKFFSKFSEDELVEYFYTYANANKEKLKIESISFSEGTFNEVGFKEGSINLNVTFFSENSMIDMINFLIDSDKYNMYIHNFTYPIGNTQQSFAVSIPIKILYK